jgi:hypothetical protein
MSRFQRGQDIVPELPQAFHDRVGKILVRVQLGHDAHASSLRRMASSISAGCWA